MASSPHPLTRRQLAFCGLGALQTLVPASRSTREIGIFASNASQVPLDDITTLNIRDFGAKGDGVTDDAPAINLALSVLRKRQKGFQKLSFGCRVLFPTGAYSVNSALNFSNIKLINFVLDGQGSVIIGRCPGQAVIDALGSRWLTMRDLTILGEEGPSPMVGIQIGRTQAEQVADEHRFDNVKVIGHFSLACLYNRAAETCQFDHLVLWNDAPSSFCLIQDGTNHFGVQSNFASVAIDQDKSMSFNENLFLNCDFRHGARGTPIWISDSARHSFIRCYSATAGDFSVEVFSGSNGHALLEIDCHCERNGFKAVFNFSSKSKTALIRGLTFRDQLCFATTSVLSHSKQVKSVVIEDMKFEIAAFKFASCQVFDSDGVWKASGAYYGPDTKSWNGSGCFRGTAALGSRIEQML